MFDLVVLGELLIDFTIAGQSSAGMRLFEQNAGGAVANVACAFSMLGGRAAFIGKVGSDMHGAFLRDTLLEKGVDVSGLVLDPDVFTTLAFVGLDDAGERTFSFARKPGADTCLRPEEVPNALLQNTKVLHIGSLSLTAEPARTATYEAVRIARAAGAIISYDPNYRASLWPNEAAAIQEMRGMLPLVDIIKLSDEEVALLSCRDTPEKAAEALLNMGIQCVAITQGEHGAYVCVQSGGDTVAAFPAQVADTTGAGDAFWGGFLHGLLSGGKQLGMLTLADACACARRGNATAALCIGKRGGIPAMPSRAEVEALLEAMPQG